MVFFVHQYPSATVTICKTNEPKKGGKLQFPVANGDKGYVLKHHGHTM